MTRDGRPLLPIAERCGCPKHEANRPAPGDQLPAGMGPAVITARLGGPHPRRVATWPLGGWPVRRRAQFSCGPCLQKMAGTGGWHCGSCPCC